MFSSCRPYSAEPRDSLNAGKTQALLIESWFHQTWKRALCEAVQVKRLGRLFLVFSTLVLLFLVAFGLFGCGSLPVACVYCWFE